MNNIFQEACTKWKGLPHNFLELHPTTWKKSKLTNFTWDGIWEKMAGLDHWVVLPGKIAAFYSISESANYNLIILIFKNSDKRGKGFKCFLMFVQQANIPNTQIDLSDFGKNITTVLVKMLLLRFVPFFSTNEQNYNLWQQQYGSF